MQIEFVGLKNLTERENSALSRVCRKSLPKIERMHKNAKMILTIKKEDKEGKRARFLLQSHINAPSVKFTAEAEAWSLPTAVHQIFTRLETEIAKKTDFRKRQKTISI